ncbi:XylR family transcriptional regulator [Cerasicoccus maritimus]|uniref:XylR family transcriptional regulator n=1 Tax=Cerasicoccus maritimus TaxID=490089 RepID=UPI002852B4A3|nr:XylR family transcriptional regulator [Cerasicoccus maritimus]
MSRKTTKRIALLLGQDIGYSRRALAGVLNYSESHALPWVFHNAPPDVRILPALERWRPDGVIVHLSDRSLGQQLTALGAPLVSVTNTVSGLRIPTVDVDSVAVGRLAAEYFLGLGLRSFAYYGSRKAQFSREREQGFRACLEERGYAVQNLHADFLPHSPFSQDWSRVDRQTERWLKLLPKPVGILVSNDIPGRVLCDICRNAGIRVPEEIAILGVDNDVSECRMSLPALSSVELPAEQIGRDAAQRLQALIGGSEELQMAVRHPPVGVIARSSTDCQATDDLRVKQAIDFIEQQADKGAGVEAVCQHIGVSRRSLERAFRAEFQTTVYEQIQRVRVARAKRLLWETELSIGAIAERSGLGNLRQMDRVFRKYEGEAPSMFRARR